MKETIGKIGSDGNREIDDDGDRDEAGDGSDNESKKMNGEEGEPRTSDQHMFKYRKTYVPGRGIERYNESLKTLIPVRRDRGATPMDNIGLFSTISQSFFSKFMYKAHSKSLEMAELPRLSPRDTCDYNADRLEALWKKEVAERGAERASFSKVAWRFCRTRILVSCSIMICSYVSTSLTYTLFMRRLLESVQSGEGSYGEGMKWALLLIAAGLTRISLASYAWMLNYTTGLRLRSACMTLVYRKMIRMNYFGHENVGEIINVFSNDAQRIFDMIPLAPLMIETPIVAGYLVFYILRIFGPMALLGMIVFALFYPLEYLISRLIGRYLTKAIKIADMRVRLINEILDCIKLIKMYAWEKRFSKDLLDKREKEQRVLLHALYCGSFNISMTPTVPAISTIITFLAHVSSGNNLTAAQAFPYSSFLDSRLRVALILFQRGLASLILGSISFQRIQNLLLSEDSKSFVVKPILRSQAVAISNGTFAYNNSNDHEEKSSRTKDEKTINGAKSSADKSEQEKLNRLPDNNKNADILFDISFEAEKGKLVGICGPVGSGKSSLLLAALGQLRISEGQVMRDGSCAYVSQQAWISNATLRENILFGDKFDQSRYQKAIYASNLSQDIDMMPGGDQTEIGEKGVNLSGGQKQRVALARALYADRDIYFLDDPLSAVDSRVGAYIFDNLILGALRGKTVLFVTHQVQYLNRCDDIYMMRDGKIVEHGTHEELIKLGNEYALMDAAVSSNNKTENKSLTNPKVEVLPQLADIIPLHRASQNNIAVATSQTNTKNIEEPSSPAAQLTVAENLGRKNIRAHACRTYIAAAGGYCFCFIVSLAFAAHAASTALSSWWLAVWIEAGGGNTTIVRNNETIISDNVNDNPDFWYYQVIYAGSIGAIVLTSGLCSLLFSRAAIGASTNLHNGLFKKIIASPMRFFDTTPSGRIQHLFSRDMDEVDKQLPETLANGIQTMFRISLSVLGIFLVLPWFVLPFGIIIGIYYLVNKRFIVAIGDLKRMENKARAPVLSFVTETVQGISTIHAYDKGNDFIAKFVSLFDENGKYLFMSSLAARWLVTRIDALSVMMIGAPAILIVVFQNQIPPALAGLALAYASQISAILPYSIKLLTEMEVRLTSMERISHYLRILKSETETKKSIAKPPPSWPVEAAIAFRNVSMAYGVGAAVILKNISFTVHAGEKIGIVGRTGSGKSSLTVALFRLVELAEGKIEIDDVDISEISLTQLRTKLSIIPQDPVLFSGTIRSNLDPFQLFTDAEIWKALEKTELRGRVQSITGQLDASVGFGGDNLSVGERQLLCLSRALLRNSKILVLDEATAAVDPETEIAVQNTIQREFSHCTILTIAHRLQTVLSLDRILVMEDGRVLEFDTPSNLLGNSNSELSKMMAAAE